MEGMNTSLHNMGSLAGLPVSQLCRKQSGRRLGTPFCPIQTVLPWQRCSRHLLCSCLIPLEHIDNEARQL